MSIHSCATPPPHAQGHAARGLGRHRTGRRDQKQTGGVAAGGGGPQRKGVKGFGGSPKALIFGQKRAALAGNARSTFGRSLSGNVGLESGVLLSCIDVAAVLVELLQHAPTSSRCNAAAACHASRLPSERAGNYRINKLAWIKARSLSKTANSMLPNIMLKNESAFFPPSHANTLPSLALSPLL